MSLRFLPLGTHLYLIGGMLFGFGVGFSTSTMPSTAALASTGIGALLIVLGYAVLRPMTREAKAQIKKRGQATGSTDTEAVAP